MLFPLLGIHCHPGHPGHYIHHFHHHHHHPHFHPYHHHHHHMHGCNPGCGCFGCLPVLLGMGGVVIYLLGMLFGLFF